MDKLLRSFITVERTFQIAALVGVVLLLGYLGLTGFQRGQERSLPVPSLSTSTQK